MSTNIIKKEYSHTIHNEVSIKFNEKLNLYDTIIEKTVYYNVKEYQKAYDKGGNEIGELSTNEYLQIERVIDTFNYLDYNSKDNSPYLGCQTLHFNNGAHLIVLRRLVTIDEVDEGCRTLNKSKIVKNEINSDIGHDIVDGVMLIAETKRKIRPSEIDKTINSYIRIISNSRVNFKSLTDGNTYNVGTNIQIVGMGHSRLMYYISSDPFDETKYKKSLKEVSEITLDIWGKESDVKIDNYIYGINKGISKISNEHKLIYHFCIDYNCSNDNKVHLHIHGVVDNIIIKKEYEVDSPEVITEIRNYISKLKKDGVYLTKEQTEDINYVLEGVVDIVIKKPFDEVIEDIIIEEPQIRKEPKTYLMKNRRNGLYKIGKSITPTHRERTLQSEEPEIEMVKVWEDNIEDRLHKKYSRSRVRGEWFKLTNTQVKYICVHY
tara:strand:- start:39 stop:1340 length:1302 start_codon:yes stop_codon:yes gene_type:complete